jgi:hypothetical protein
MNTLLKKTLLAWVLFLLSQPSVFAQVVINEICPSNISVIQNSNGEYDDWIELYNTSGSTLNLEGYGLSDDITKLYRFTFPSVTLNSGQRIIVFASDSTSEVIAHHYEMAVNGQSSWKYKAGSAALDTNWRNNSFNDASWSSGSGGIGNGDGDDGTTIPATVSVMMRKTFTIPDTSQIVKCVFMMDYDDGFVAYLNGVEIARANIANSGRPAWNALASSSHEALDYQNLPRDSFFIDPTFLKTIIRQGSNVLTVETHDVSSSSTDMSSEPYLFFGMKSSGLTFSNLPSWFNAPSADYYNAHFKLSRTGETIYLTNPGGTIINQVTYTTMDINNSYGRKPDGANSFCYFSTPTPTTSNNSSTCYTGYAGIPIFNKFSGFYSSTQTITISTSTPGATIRYTTNGNTPKTTDALYTGPITVSSSKTIRARVFASGMLPGPIVANTYLINVNTHLPVFSITTDSLNLWDYNTGIYVMGPNASNTSPYFGANFWQDWSKDATIEYFDKGQNSIAKFDAEISIYGNYSRAKPQKSFEIKLSDRYGTSDINYQFYPDKPYIDKASDLILRNAGTDWNVVHFRDALMERVMRNTNVGYLATQPVIMFLNGAYWGVYHINENHDSHWVKDNFGLGSKDISFLKESGSTIEVKDGSDATFWDMYNYATSQSPTSASYYDHMNSVLDLKNYADYFAAETFYNNGDWIGDWTNNIKLWRSNEVGGKWKYFLYDTDFGLGLNGSVNDNRLSSAINPASFSYISEMFDKITDNPNFKRYFINRYADLINTIYLPSNMSDEIDHFKDSMSYDMTAHFAKWGSNSATWQSKINSMITFVNARPNIVRDQIKTVFGLTAKVTLTLNVSPAGAGRIEISTITPETYPWSGVYFNGNPVTITAIPNPGYSFDHFRSNLVITSNNYNQSVTYNFTGNDAITAYFTGSASNPKLTISELNYNSDSATDAGDWIELHNFGSHDLDLSGWKVKDSKDNHSYAFPTGTVIAANGYLVLMEDSIKFASQYPTVHNTLGNLGFNLSNGGDQIRIFDHADNLYLDVNYQDLAPWPITPDGGGYTCELINQNNDLNDGNNWFAGCLGGSPGRAYSGSLSTPVSIDGNTTFCSGGSTTLTATSVAGYSYQWRRNNVVINGATSNSFTITQAGNYTVQVSNAGCSVITPPTTVTLVTQAPDPVTVSSSVCASGQVTLTATASDSIFWYDAINGNEIGVGETFVTPLINSTTTYYARSSRSCPSNFVAAVAVVNPQAATPITSDVIRCGPGTVTLTASDTAVIHWYNAPTGGGLLATGTSFLTGIIPNDSIFYVEAGDYCPSQRIEVKVTISTTAEPLASDASRCGTGTITLTASSASPIFWYTSEFGGASVGSGASFTTPTLAVSDTFWVEANGGCASSRVRVIALVNTVPAVPTATNVTICGSGSATFNAISTEQVYWYDAALGGNLLYTGTNFTTPVLSSTTNYYIEAGYICRSTRRLVTATVTAFSAPPTTADVARCGPGAVNLLANSPELINWYDSLTGGTLVFTGDAFTTPALNITTPYYAEAGTTCPSTRVQANAIINPIPSPATASDVSRCGNGTVTLTANSPETIYWFANAVGGAALATGPSFTTPTITSTTTYYVETGNSCRSSRIPVQAIIATQPAAPLGTDGVRCGTGVVTLNASSTETINWFSAINGGVSLGTGPTFTTPSLSSTTIYYVEAGNGCNSARTPVTAIITPLPATPTASNVSLCGSNSFTLNAAGTETIYWYDAASGGNLLNTGASYVTPVIASTTTYYVEQGDNCRSNRLPVNAIVNPLPAAPTASDVNRCGTGTVSLTATGNGTISWYDQATGGALVTTGTSYTTPSLTSTTTYYLEANNGCISATRTAVQAIINAIPAAPTAAAVNRCGTGTVTLNASSPEQIYWYSASSGGVPLATGPSFTTPSISSTTTYYVEAGNSCRSIRVAVQAVVTAAPASPNVSGGSRCGAGTVQLTATATTQINWYDVASGGVALGTGGSFTTPSISSTTVYFADAGTGCNSPRVPVNATINTIPATPSTADVARCDAGIVTLTATSPEQIYWYDAAVGGNLLATGTSYTTPSNSVTTTYYLETGNTCRSPRISVNAVINAPATAPTVTNGSRCGTGAVVLNASAATQINWYTSAVGGAAVATGTSYTTPSINVNTTYYADAGTGCNSARVPVQAIINPIAASPMTSDVSRCGVGSVTLSASSPEQIYWYDAASGGNLLATASSYTTPALLASVTYYVEAGNTCRSPRIAVQAIITTVPSSPAVSDVSRCGDGTVTFNAISLSTVNWYASAVGGVSLGTGLTFTTPTLTSTTTFYADAGSACNSPRVPVQAIINPVPTTPVTNSASICSSGTVNLSASSNGPLYWYDAFTGGNLLASGNTYTTPFITSTTTYYVEAGDLCKTTRVMVQAIITSPPSAPNVTNGSRCGIGSVQLTATSATQINWYSSAVGGAALGTGTSFNTPSISNTTTFYADAGLGCNSARVPVIATVNSLPADPSATAASRCGTGTVTLSANSANNLSWFANSTGGPVLGTGTSFTTPSITSTTIYYVEANDGTCSSNRVAVIATVDPIPPAPNVTDVSRCNTGSLTLSVVSPETVRWYDSPSGGVLLATGNSFVTPALNTTTAYYVSVGTVCVSPRAQIYAIITTPPADPLVTDNFNCGTGSVTLLGSATAPISWYDSLGVLQGTGNTFNTPVITASTVFYAQAGVGCNSNLVAVNAIINPIPASPIVSDASICGPGTATLTTTSPEAIYWYDDTTATNLLDVGPTLITPMVMDVDTFYVQTGDVCRSALVPAIVTVLPISEITSVAAASNCGPGTLDLQAQSADVINWYDQVGGTLLFTGSIISTTISTTTSYYVVAGSDCPSAPQEVIATIFDLPVVDLGPDTIYAQSGNVVDLDAGIGFDTYKWTTTELTQIISVTITGSYGVQVVDTNGCVATDEIYVDFSNSIVSENLSNALSVYPNPTHDRFVLELKNNHFKKLTMRLMSTDGKIVQTKTLTNGIAGSKAEFTLENYAAGIYYLQVISDNETALIRVVLQ